MSRNPALQWLAGGTRHVEPRRTTSNASHPVDRPAVGGCGARRLRRAPRGSTLTVRPANRVAETRFGGSITLLFMVAALAGCGGTAVTASPAPASSPSASPTASPDPNAEAATAYLALATRITAEIASVGTLSAGASLAVVKDYYLRLARIQEELLAGVQAISFPPSVKTHVEDLIRAADALRKVDASIAASATPAQLKTRLEGLGPATLAMTVAANNLRRDLDLPPSGTPSPSPTASPAPSIDPGAELRIGPPYALMPVTAAELAEFQALFNGLPGVPVTGYRFGVRAVTRGGDASRPCWSSRSLASIRPGIRTSSTRWRRASPAPIQGRSAPARLSATRSACSTRPASRSWSISMPMALSWLWVPRARSATTS